MSMEKNLLVEMKGWHEQQRYFFLDFFKIIIIITIVRPESIYPVDWASAWGGGVSVQPPYLA